MARWRLKLQEELPEVFNEVQKDDRDFSQAHAFCCLRDVYQESIKQRNTTLIKTIIQFASWVIEEGRDDMKGILAACFVEHIYDGLGREDIKYLHPLLEDSTLLKFSKTIPLCSYPEK
ncbi:MAG TPA: hypothetical protein PKB02_14865 [Anaerohalosphaeraceae bacterium]|jgi:hypothetical protein|nr:hypothetical protein [Anaerohalosphaeraceae bacterium]